jgi:hypothetical protein
MALAYVTTLRNSRLDQITSAIGNAGLLRIYDGTRPSTGGAATTLLAELTGGSPWAASAASGVVTANAITTDASANASSTATWHRWTTSGGTAVIDGNVGTSSSDLNLTTTAIVITQPVAVSSYVITEGNP